MRATMVLPLLALLVFLFLLGQVSLKLDVSASVSTHPFAPVPVSVPESERGCGSSVLASKFVFALTSSLGREAGVGLPFFHSVAEEVVQEWEVEWIERRWCLSCFVVVELFL